MVGGQGYDLTKPQPPATYPQGLLIDAGSSGFIFLFFGNGDAHNSG